jgi:UDP-N-acetylmuramoyl-L-alanyl-D-glutamate--2,6-diaminopimelate ligase
MGPLTLAQLCMNLREAALPAHADHIRVGRVRDDSRQVERGDVFVAVRGTAADGADHAAEAAARGAAAIVTEGGGRGATAAGDLRAAAANGTGGIPVALAELNIPLVRVPSARIALAELAAASLGYPAEQLDLVGITGTVGKTSVLALLAAILDRAGIPAGTMGSLGIEYPGSATGTPNTTPGALAIQEALSRMLASGVRIAAMEVTSHALVQERVHGLRYSLGIFTNLTMLEHLEYHGSFREYAAAKLRFLETLRPSAPLCYAAGDRVVRQAVRRHPGPRISCGGGGAWVRVRRDAMSLTGTRLRLQIRRELPRLDGSCLAACTVPLQLRTLGRPNTVNATLAATAGLIVGATPDVVHDALSRIRPPKRRLEVIRDCDPIVIDDTVGHPDSITGVFELAERVSHGALRVVFCIRGRRGAEINARDAEALAIWGRRIRIARLHVTSAEDTADKRNAVSDAERRAFMAVLQQESVRFTHHDRLADAIATALDGAAGSDLVLLLGAQGMDAGADIVRRLLGQDP